MVVVLVVVVSCLAYKILSMQMMTCPNVHCQSHKMDLSFAEIFAYESQSINECLVYHYMYSDDKCTTITSTCQTLILLSESNVNLVVSIISFLRSSSQLLVYDAFYG